MCLQGGNGWCTKRTEGFVLVIVLVLLAALASLGVSSVRSALGELTLVKSATEQQQLQQYALAAINCVMQSVRDTGEVFAVRSNTKGPTVLARAPSLSTKGVNAGVPCPEIQKAQVHFLMGDVSVSALTQYCGKGAPLAASASDGGHFQAEHYVTTAAAYRAGEAGYRMYQQGWSRQVPRNPSQLPGVNASAEPSAEYGCDQGVTLKVIKASN